ncbi:MAG: hypothetical protein GF405_00530 [Candidatus Eisenbacteria bacterium]|nr:hypothetical protein [Candidatus Eisenbacteria bacterium]
MSRRSWSWALVAIMAIAVVLRFWNIDWGLPHPYHPDEGSILVHSLGFGTGDLNPHWFRWPSLLMYVVFALYGFYYVIGRVFGFLGAPVDLVTQFFTDVTPFWLIGRAVSAVAGVVTVGLTWRFGRKAFGPFAGISAALLLAVVYLHVRDSHYATPDVFTTFLVTASMLSALAAAHSGRGGMLVLSGLFAGLAASAKYPGVLAGAGTVAAAVYLMVTGRRAAGALVGAILAGAFGFVAGTPYSVISWSEFTRDVATQFFMVSRTGVAQIPTSFGEGMAELFGGTLGRGIGYPVLALAALGLLSSLGRDRGDGRRPGEIAREPAGVVVAGSVALAYLLFALFLTVKRSTYMTPALPAVVLLAGLGLRRIFDLIEPAPERRFGFLRAAALVAAAVVTLLPTLEFVRVIGLPDTRTAAKHWIENELRAGSSVAVETYGPPIHPLTSQVREELRHDTTDVDTWAETKDEIAGVRLAVASQRLPQYWRYTIGWGEAPNRLPAAGEDPEGLIRELERHGIRYVVVTSKAEPGRPMEGAAPPNASVERPFYEWLSENGLLARRFRAPRPVPPIDRGAGRSFHNPVIEIFDLEAVDRREGDARAEAVS